MARDISKDIRPITNVKKHTREKLDAKAYETHLKASDLARFLGPAEADVAGDRTRPIRTFLREFKNAHENFH